MPHKLHAEICIDCREQIIRHHPETAGEETFNTPDRGRLYDIKESEEEKGSDQEEALSRKKKDGQQVTAKLIDHDVPAVLSENILGITGREDPEEHAGKEEQEQRQVSGFKQKYEQKGDRGPVCAGRVRQETDRAKCCN